MASIFGRFRPPRRRGGRQRAAARRDAARQEGDYRTEAAREAAEHDGETAERAQRWIEVRQSIEAREREQVGERMGLSYVAAPWNAGSLFVIFAAATTFAVVSYLENPRWWQILPAALAAVSLVGAVYFTARTVRGIRSGRLD